MRHFENIVIDVIFKIAKIIGVATESCNISMMAWWLQMQQSSFPNWNTFCSSQSGLSGSSHSKPTLARDYARKMAGSRVFRWGAAAWHPEILKQAERSTSGFPCPPPLAANPHLCISPICTKIANHVREYPAITHTCPDLEHFECGGTSLHCPTHVDIVLPSYITLLYRILGSPRQANR